jgi:hypothetical protein
VVASPTYRIAVEDALDTEVFDIWESQLS